MVKYSASANTGTSSRTGTMTIAGQSFTVLQAGQPCTYSFSLPPVNPIKAGAGTASEGYNPEDLQPAGDEQYFLITITSDQRQLEREWSTTRCLPIWARLRARGR